MSESGKSLDISEDLQHQKREWIAERVGWAIIAALLMATALGAFGRGVLSARTIGEPGAPLQVHYQRHERYKAVTTLKVSVIPPQGETTARVTIGREFLNKVRITEIVPDAASVEAGPEGHTFEFDLRADGAPADFFFFYEPFNSGGVTTRVSLENSSSYEFRQFFFP